MKQLVVGLVATLATGVAFAQQQPVVLAHAESQGVTVNGQAVPAANSLGAVAGDVVAVTSGEAKVTYANGCSVTVTPAAPYRIQAKGPRCASPAKAAASDNKYYWAIGAGLAVVVGIASGGGGGDDAPSSP